MRPVPTYFIEVGDCAADLVQYRQERDTMMKKTKGIAIALALELALASGSAALAEHAAEGDKAETKFQTPSEAAEEDSASQENAFFAWIGQKMDQVGTTMKTGLEMGTDAARAGFDMASEAAVSGMGWLDGKISDWTGRAEAYMKEKQWDKTVLDAWETLKTGARDAGKVTQESLDSAYRTMKDWLEDSEVDQSVAEAVEGVAEAAGVAEAEVYGWYRRMENYMTENASLANDSVREAWNEIKQYASEAGSVTDEQVRAAYSSIRDWLISNGEAVDSEIIRMLDERSIQQQK